MAVREGYRQTEVGEIPTEWNVSALAKIGEWKGGATPSMQVLRFWKNGTTPWISSGDVKSVYLYDAPMKITDEAIKKSSTTLMPAKSIVTVTRSGILRKYFPVAMTMVSMAINQDIKALKVNPLNCPSFILYLLLWSGPRILATCMKSGTTVESVEFAWLKSFPVPLPPTKAEQEAIAEALSDADGLIESLERLIAKKRQIKQGAMQELLTGKRRLPGFEVEPGYKHTEVGEIPKDWEAKPLKDIGDTLIGLTYRPDDVDTDGTLVLRASNIKNGTLSFEDNVYVNVEVPSKIMVCHNDILICARNGSRQLIGKCALIDSRADGMTFGAFMAIYRSPINAYLIHLFQSAVLKKQIVEHLGATINQITNKSLKSFWVPLPSSSEQKTIATILSDMDSEITELEAKLTKARKVKQGMMQELLTGRIRLV